MIFNTFLILMVLFSAGYLVFRAFKNTKLLLQQSKQEESEYPSREIEYLIESAIEENLFKLQDELKQRATYEDDDNFYFEKKSNNNTILFQ